jgi:hypothetical protein
MYTKTKNYIYIKSNTAIDRYEYKTTDTTGFSVAETMSGKGYFSIFGKNHIFKVFNDVTHAPIYNKRKG